jgi:class 3 adenylate cyclase
LNLNALLEACDSHVREELDLMPKVVDVTDFDPVTADIPITARRWLRVENVVAVVADLKSSTKLGLNKYAQSTASIYEAALRPVVDIFNDFGAGWIPIHGDCVIGVFWDGAAVERAMCAAITARTFSENKLTYRLAKKWPDLPDTGFKVGVSTSTLLVKRIGRPHSPHQDLVWPGKALNYAVKAAQTADAHTIVVTGSIWDAISNNDFLTYSCDCASPSPTLWHDHDIEKLDHDEAERSGRMLTSAWCGVCGESFCNAILAGETDRDIPKLQRAAQRSVLFHSSLAKKHQQTRANRRNFLARVGR